MPEVLGAAAIFGFRVIDVSLGTLRSLLAVRGYRAVAASLGLIEATIFVLAVSRVVQHADQPLNVVGYAVGFATGNFVGVTVEAWLGAGLQTVHVISGHAAGVVAALRAADFGVTTLPAEGRDGPVTLALVMARRRRVPELIRLVRQQDPEAFVTVEELRAAVQGYLPRH